MRREAVDPESKGNGSRRAQSETVRATSTAVGRDRHTTLVRHGGDECLDVWHVQLGKVAVQHGKGFNALGQGSLTSLVESGVQAQPVLDKKPRAARLDQL